MLLEMWAYVCDVLSFYDETIAHESYLRTARRDRRCACSWVCSATGPAPRLRPGSACAVKAAGRARRAAGRPGRALLGLRRANHRRSSSSTPTARVHPLLNGWQLAPTRPRRVREGAHQLLLGTATGQGARRRSPADAQRSAQMGACTPPDVVKITGDRRADT